jgi:hypothetical protein
MNYEKTKEAFENVVSAIPRLEGYKKAVIIEKVRRLIDALCKDIRDGQEHGLKITGNELWEWSKKYEK